MNSSQLIDQAFALTQKGNYRRACDLLNQAIRLDPTAREPQFALGVCYFQMKNADRAIDIFTQCLNADSTFAPAYRFRGQVYLDQKKDYDKAIADFTRALQYMPNDWQIYAFRGDAYAGKVRKEKSLTYKAQGLADYQMALRLCGNDLMGQTLLMTNWQSLEMLDDDGQQQRERADRERADRERVEREQRERVERERVEREQREQAEQKRAEQEQFDRAFQRVRANSKDDQAWQALGLILHVRGEEAKAHECFQRAQRWRPTSVQPTEKQDPVAPALVVLPVAPPAHIPQIIAVPAPAPVVSSAAPVATPVATNCPQCGCPIIGTADFCLMCGTRWFASVGHQHTVAMAPTTSEPAPDHKTTSVCPKCSNFIGAGSRFCMTCGYDLKNGQPSTDSSSTPVISRRRPSYDLKNGQPSTDSGSLPVVETTFVPQPVNLATPPIHPPQTQPVVHAVPLVSPSAQPTYTFLSADTIVALMEQMGNLDDTIAQQAAQQISLGGPAMASQLLEALGSGKGLFGTGKAAEQRRQWAIAALIEIGPPVIPDLIRALGNDNKKQCEGVTIALTRIGALAVAPLIEALPRLATNAYLPAILAKIGVPAQQPLAQFMRSVGKEGVGWDAADMALCAIVGAPTRSEISTLEQRTQIPTWGFLIVGCLGFLIGLGQGIQNGLMIGLFLGYLAWSIAWGGYSGWLGVIFSVIIAPFAALNHHLKRKKKTKARAQFESTYLA